MDQCEKDAVSIWTKLLSIPRLQNASLSSNGNIVQIESVWQVTDPAKHDDSSISKSWVFDLENEKLTALQSRINSSAATVLRKSATLENGVFAQIVEIEVGKAKEKFAERWNQDRRLDRVPLTKVVESIPKDAGVSGHVALSNDGSHFLFAAELKVVKKSFFDEIDEKDESATYGTKFNAQQTWGEQMTKTISPSLVMVNFETKIVSKADRKGQSFGDPQINSHGDIVYCAHDEKPFKLGRIYCTNRPISIVATNIEEFEDIDKHRIILNGSCRSPRFIPSSRKFVYLKRDPFGPHIDCDVIDVYDLETETNSNLVPEVNEYPKTDDDFAGIYCSSLSRRPFVSVNNESILIVSSAAKNRLGTFAISISSGNIMRLRGNNIRNGSTTLLSTEGNMALLSHSTHNQSSTIQLVSFESEKLYKIHQISTASDLTNYDLKNYELTSKAGCPFQSHLLSKSGNKCLMLRPHGGPNSSCAISCILTYNGILELGYDLLLPNYVGSTGYGKDQVHALAGHIGDYDVNDCLTALDAVLAEKSYENVFVCGGSHGGFLAAHLSAARPKQFDAAGVWNGVINLNTMRNVTDIPDWCDYQAFGTQEQFKFGSVLTPEKMKQMHEMSPISRADRVICPTLVGIGWKDLRVPPPQGVEWVRALESNGVKCLQLDFPEDCHPIDKTDSYAHEFVHNHSWFQKHKKSTADKTE